MLKNLRIINSYEGSQVKFLFIFLLIITSSCGRDFQGAQNDSTRKDFILGNKVTTTDDFASVVQIVQYDNHGNKVSGCSGTVVCEGNRSCRKSNLVKTSAHCFIQESFFEQYGAQIEKEMSRSRFIRRIGPNSVQITQPFFSMDIQKAIYNNIRRHIQKMKIRSYKDKKLREHQIIDFSLNPAWVSYYTSLLSQAFMNNQSGIQLLAQQKEKHSALDQAYLKLKAPIDDVKIYRETSIQDVKDHLTEGQMITISGWGLNQDDFNFGIVSLGQNNAHPINDIRLETQVKVRKGLDSDNFFYIGEFSDWPFKINANQQGACPGDSGGGAFMKINGEMRHIGTITSGQLGLCGLPIPQTPDGKVIEPKNVYHSKILVW